MKITRSFFLLVLPILSLLTSLSLESRSLLMGVIEFPKELPTVPNVRLYCGGKIIKCLPDHENKTITFSIPRLDRQYRFNLLITESIEFAHEYIYCMLHPPQTLLL